MNINGVKMYKANVNILIALTTTIFISACSTSNRFNDAVIPKSTTSVFSAGDNSQVVQKVGYTQLATPTNQIPSASRSYNLKTSNSRFIQAFLNMGLDARETNDGFVVFLPTSGHFDTNKSNIKPNVSSTISQIVSEANKGYLAGHKIEIAGHADKPGSLAHNQALSLRRANRVMKQMISNGLSSNRVTPKGFGERLPLHTTNTQYNRRADIIFINP